jgi:hypothetical protein
MNNVLCPLWLASTKGGEGKRIKLNFLTYKNTLITESENIYNLDDVINLACFQILKEKNG